MRTVSRDSRMCSSAVGQPCNVDAPAGVSSICKSSRCSPPTAVQAITIHAVVQLRQSSHRHSECHLQIVGRQHSPHRRWQVRHFGVISWFKVATIDFCRQHLLLLFLTCPSCLHTKLCRRLLL